MLFREIKRLAPEAGTYKKIGITALIDLLDISRGSQFVAATTLTVPDYRVSDCPYRDNLYKLCRRVYHINAPYENCVNNQRKREGLKGKFHSHPRHWGGRVIGPPFVVHEKNGNVHLYLEAKIHQELGHEYLGSDYTVIPEEKVAPYIRERGPRPCQGTEKPTEIRNILVEHILTLVIQGQGYYLHAR